ncbi:hypothetical protein D3C79_853830 [compost metagenome]
MGIDLALARAQKSPPGQAMMSVSMPILAVPRSRSQARRQSACKSCLRTSGRIRFCSWAIRISPKPNCSDQSATASICAAVRSPGGEDIPGLVDSTTLA